ncbi:hypothetical protein HYV57_00570 [Candidatus Peregrinibacteria bacterium]|nr:hypothetical protein [Candidatus Peregrinibacteria bacterium]
MINIQMNGDGKNSDDQLRVGGADHDDDSIIDDDVIERKFQEHISCLMPSMLSSLASEQPGVIVLQVRNSLNAALRYQRNNPATRVDPLKIIEGSASEWIAAKKQIFAYSRYCKLMEEQGEDAIEFDLFRKYTLSKSERSFGEGRGRLPTYDRFCFLEKHGIKVGTRLKNDEGIVFTVSKINRFAQLILVDQKGKILEGSNLINFIYHFGQKWTIVSDAS